MPPLRERQDDLPLLVASFVEEVARGRDRGVVEVGDDVVPLLSRHSFPGNVRELRSMIFDAVYRVQDHVLTASDFKSLPGTVAPRAPAAESVPDVAFGGKLPQLKEVGDLLVAEALRRTAGNQSKAAGLLGVSHQALSKRLRSGNRQDQSR